MVTLEKPLGLTLAPDPVTGRIVVQNIKEGSPAALSQLIQVGDTVKKCSAVFGEEMWMAVDIRRVRWAINNRVSKVKLVLERPLRPLSSPPVWYGQGRTGQASSWPHGPEREALTSPISFSATASLDDMGLDRMSCPGKPLMVGFHRTGVFFLHSTLPLSSSLTTTMTTSSLVGGRRTSHASSTFAARSERLQILREELSHGGRKNMINLFHEPPFVPQQQQQGGSYNQRGLSDPFNSPSTSSRAPEQNSGGLLSSFSQPPVKKNKVSHSCYIQTSC